MNHGRICLLDAGPLINFAYGGMLDTLTQTAKFFKTVITDTVLDEATISGKPFAHEIETWINMQTKAKMLEIGSTETGRLIRKKRETEPNFRLKNSGEKTIFEWIQAQNLPASSIALIIHEDKAIPKLLKEIKCDAKLYAVTPYAFLTLTERLGVTHGSTNEWKQKTVSKPGIRQDAVIVSNTVGKMGFS